MLASHIRLREIGTTFDLERVDLKTHKTSKGEDFYAINPVGGKELSRNRERTLC